jgi:hypothetical protein
MDNVPTVRSLADVDALLQKYTKKVQDTFQELGKNYQNIDSLAIQEENAILEGLKNALIK